MIVLSIHFKVSCENAATLHDYLLTYCAQYDTTLNHCEFYLKITLKALP